MQATHCGELGEVRQTYVGLQHCLPHFAVTRCRQRPARGRHVQNQERNLAIFFGGRDFIDVQVLCDPAEAVLHGLLERYGLAWVCAPKCRPQRKHIETREVREMPKLGIHAVDDVRGDKF